MQQVAKHPFVIIGAVIIIAAIALIGRFVIMEATQTEEQKVVPQVKEVTNQDLIKSFYSWYMGDANLSALVNPDIVARMAREHEFITAAYENGMPKMPAVLQKKFDVITCTSKKPKAFSIQNIEGSSVTATQKFDKENNLLFSASSSIPGHMLLINLRKENDTWKIQSVTCPIVPNIDEVKM